MHMLQIFYLDVTYVLQRFSSISCVFLQVFQTYVLFIFRRMLQMLYLDVSKVDWVFESPSLVLVINDTKLLMSCDQM
jgi:hypothetical protein